MANETQKGLGDWGTVQRVTWEQDRDDERSFWASKTIPERLAAMVELNKRAFVLQAEEAYDGTTARLVRRPARR